MDEHEPAVCLRPGRTYRERPPTLVRVNTTGAVHSVTMRPSSRRARIPPRRFILGGPTTSSSTRLPSTASTEAISSLRRTTVPSVRRTVMPAGPMP